jgi:predicted nucleic acid-binding protein
MTVIVDTSIWSLALRRKGKDLSPTQRASTLLLRDLISAGVVALPGVVRQEVLSGIRSQATFDRIAEYLGDFSDVRAEVEDFEEGARCYNRCFDAGVAPSTPDMMICALALRLDASIFSSDPDFQMYSGVLGVRVPTLAQLQTSLHRIGRGEE